MFPLFVAGIGTVIMQAKLHGENFFVGQVMGFNPHQFHHDYATGTRVLILHRKSSLEIHCKQYMVSRVKLSDS